MVNWCNTLECVQNARLTKELYSQWLNPDIEDIQISANNVFFSELQLPEIDYSRNLQILEFDIDKLKKSNTFPYGLTNDKITKLKEAGYLTVGAIAEAPNDDIMKIMG